jgi:hypothetical protein
MRLLRREEGIGLRRGADLPGALLVVTALMLAVYTIVGAADHGWASTRTLSLGGASVALLAAFIVREARTTNPLMPLHVFRSRTVSAANLIQTLMVAGLLGMFFLGSLYLERVLGFGAIQIGLAFLPVALAIGTLSLGFAARLITRFGARATLLPGLVLIVVGLLGFRRVPVDADYLTDILPVMLLLGIGGGLSFPSLMTLAMQGATASDSGLISGLANTSQQVGGALGLAVLATLSTTRSNSLLAGGEPVASALTDGYHIAFATGAVLVIAAIVLTLTLCAHGSAAPPPRRRPVTPPRSWPSAARGPRGSSRIGAAPRPARSSSRGCCPPQPDR